MSDKMTTKKVIENVTDFMEAISALQKKQKSKHDCFFYRGLLSASYDLRPPLFRREDYPAKEKLLMQELLSRQAPAFAKDKTMFERLVRAQHYELPTRLMDVTDNPLIALYFACADWKTGQAKIEKNCNGKNIEKNGKIVIFCQERQNIHYFNSHRTKLLSNLAQLSQTRTFRQKRTKSSRYKRQYNIFSSNNSRGHQAS
ncbi:FRG domain-containing protein [Acetobacteraceae bacterium]|nr:FRG domain-containing protein [Acetobacteraceae bacterium]